jgi:hypothetical protein
MRTKRLREVRELVATLEFTEWWQSLVQARIALDDAEADREEQLAQLSLMEFRAELTQKNAIDTLYRAGEYEDHAARALAEAEGLENRGFPGVAAFEEQRFKVSELWYRLGAAETALVTARERQLPPGTLAALERKRQLAADDYERETAKKNRLWEEVERLWARSAEVSLLRGEEQQLARKVRREAELTFGLAEERKQKVRALKQGLEEAALAVERAAQALQAHRQLARARFGCIAGTDFLYFRLPDDPQRALAVCLVEDRQSYNLEVQPLEVYLVTRALGVGALEVPRFPPPSDDEGDRRFETYFLKGRKGSSAFAAPAK